MSKIRMEQVERDGWRQAIRQFVKDAVHPPILKRWSWVWSAVAVLAVIAPTAISAVLGAAPLPMLVVLLFVVVVGLLLVQGARLQKAANARREARFTCRSHIEKVKTELTVGAETFRDNLLLWVRVENEGPAADFSARLLRFRGLPYIDEPFYEVPEAAWEQNLDKSLHLARGGIGRLRIGFFSLNPRALWFYAARSAAWSKESHQASGRFMGFEGECGFDLVIHDETDDLSRVYQATVTVSPDGTLGFRIDEEGRNFGLHVMSPRRPVMGGGETGPAGVGRTS